VLRAGPRGQPLVRVEPGQRLVRPDPDEVSPAAVVVRVCADEAVRVVHGREPRLHEVRAERDHDLRVGEIVARQHVRAEEQAVGRAHRLERERVEPHPLDAERGGPLVQQPVHGAREAGCEEDRTPRRLLERGDQALLGLIPGQRLELAVHPREGLRHPVRVVQPVQRGLPARAEAAVRDRRERIALRLHRTPFPRPDVHAAAGGALPARGAEPRREAGDHVLRRDHVWQQPLRALRRATEQPGAGASGPDDLEELTAFHAHERTPQGLGSAASRRPGSALLGSAALGSAPAAPAPEAGEEPSGRIIRREAPAPSGANAPRSPEPEARRPAPKGRSPAAAKPPRRPSVVTDEAVNADITLLVAVDAPPHLER